MKKQKSIDVAYKAISLLNKHSIYWLTASYIGWECDLSEDTISNELDEMVELKLVTRLDYAIVWYKITESGIRRVKEFRLQTGI